MASISYNFQSALSQHLHCCNKDASCSQKPRYICKGSVTHKYTPGQLLCVETNCEEEYPLCDIPVSLHLQQPFTLRGIVAYIPGPKELLGHYVAFCRRSASVWEKYDDLSTRVIAVSGKTKIRAHAIIFTKDN